MVIDQVCVILADTENCLEDAELRQEQEVDSEVVQPEEKPDAALNLQDLKGKIYKVCQNRYCLQRERMGRKRGRATRGRCGRG